MTVDWREQLSHPEGAMDRLAHDTLVHMVRQSGPLQQVRVAIPATWDTEAFRVGLAARYAERGWGVVAVDVLTTDTPTTDGLVWPRLLSVVTG